MSIILIDKEINGTPQQKIDLWNDLIKQNAVQNYKCYLAGMENKEVLHARQEMDHEEMKNNPEQFNYNQK